MSEDLPMKSPERIKSLEEKDDLLRVKIISGDELLAMVYKGNVLPQDRRFFDIKEGGVFKYFILEILLNRRKNIFYSIAKVDDKIVGLCELEKSPYQENLYWIKFVSVDPKYEGRGYASKITEEAFRFAKEKGVALEASMYSPEGLKKLKPLLHKLAAKFDVEFIEQK